MIQYFAVMTWETCVLARYRWTLSFALHKPFPLAARFPVAFGRFIGPWTLAKSAHANGLEQICKASLDRCELVEGCSKYELPCLMHRWVIETITWPLSRSWTNCLDNCFGWKTLFSCGYFVAYVISILVLNRGNLVNGIRLREHQRKSRIPK